MCKARQHIIGRRPGVGAEGSQPTARAARILRSVVLTVGLGGMVVLAAGCGGNSSVPAASASQVATFNGAAFRYSACMREHGVSDFPSPTMTDHNGQQVAFMNPSSAVIASPAYKIANKVCATILPPPITGPSALAQHERELHVLAFASCMRSHGVSNFPDPTSQGGALTTQIVTNAGVDLQSPAALSAVKACLPSAGGAITGQEVQRTLNAGQ
jgi:hypothetical protein